VVANRALPAPSKNALLVRVKACGVNPVDAKGVIGDKLPPFMRGFARRLVDGKIAGFDLSGVVEHAPPGCGFAVGDEVYGAVPPFRGALAELVSVPLDQVAAKPQSLTHEEAAALVLPGVTVAQLLDQHGFAAGQHVLVLGASGGVGHLAVQVLRARGAGFVAGVCSAKNAAFCESVGAHAVAAYDADDAEKNNNKKIDASDDALVASLRSMVEKNERPFDLVIDTVTSHDARDASCAYERRVRGAKGVLRLADAKARDANVNYKKGSPGEYVVIGGGTAEWLKAGLKRVCGIDLFAKGRELFWIRFPGCRKDLDSLRALADGAEDTSRGIKPRIAQTHPLTSEGARAAFAALHSRRTVGKVVVTP
jgi:NADPH:quinone reductase-like Zn-dependent oxidoreductase